MEQPGRAGQRRAGRLRGLEPLGAGDPPRIGGYRLIGRLGEGGMGQVFLARSDRGRTVAVKLVRGELAGQEEFRARFRQEVRAARRVGGEWTAPVLDADTEAATPWVATGYIAGPSLQQVVAGTGAGTGTPLPERTVWILAAGLARALQSVHAAGIIHRDLKPSNVLITIDGPRVIDFGIARALEAVTGTGLTQTGAAVGSPGFMSPEQVRGEALTQACDVFCLGSVLTYAATGRQPFGTETSGAHAVMYRIAEEQPDLSAVPEALRAVIAGCLAKDPAARPTPEQLVAAAEAHAGGGQEADDEPWLPGALVARLGRHAVELLEAEHPQGGTDGAGARLAPPEDAGPAPAPDAPAPAVHAMPTAVSATTPPRPTPPPSAAPYHPAAPSPYHHQAAPAAHAPYTTPAPAPYPAAGPPTPPPTAVPQPPAPRRRRAGRAVLIVLALALAGAGATAGYVTLVDKKAGAHASAGEDDGAGGKKGQGSSGGGIPRGFIGTWSTTVGDDGEHTRQLTLLQGKPGDTVLRMEASGPAYHCEFTATLKHPGPPVRLGPSVVTSGPAASCRPGATSTLRLVKGKLRRTLDDGKAPLTYEKTG